jgi:hypothetical protein
MRWIKLFEGFGRDEYYQEISSDEYQNLLGETDDKHTRFINTFSFNEKEIDDIKSSIKSPLQVYVLNKNEWIYIFQYMNREEFDKPRERTGHWAAVYNRWGISKLDDEWYLVEGYINWVDSEKGRSGGVMEAISYYYKCDQFEGLMELLKDKEIIR